MKKHTMHRVSKLRSIGTLMALFMGLLTTGVILVISIVSLNRAQDAYLDLVIRDLTFIAEHYVGHLDEFAAKDTPEEFMVHAKPFVDSIGKDYFEAYGMTGYATLWQNNGDYLYHPKIAPGANFSRDFGEQGKQMFQSARAVNFNGVVYYQWQNAGESHPREKVAVLRTFPSRPDWHLQITAYTADDLLLPFAAVRNTVIVVALVLMVFAMTVGTLLSRRYTKPIQLIAEQLDRMSGGDLSEDPRMVDLARRPDEIGGIARSYVAMNARLRKMLREIADLAGRVRESSESLGEIATSTSAVVSGVTEAISQVAQGAQEQASAAQTTSQSMEDLKRAVSHVASGSQEQVRIAQEMLDIASSLEEAAVRVESETKRASDGSSRVRSSAIDGAQLAEQTVQGMQRIQQAVQRTEKALAELESRSAQIGEITEIITSIADQTDLLALNAAIEAARAGEHGRGFAVVADEIRKLADRSSESAKGIASLIKEIQGVSKESVAVMASGSAEVKEGVRLVTEVGGALKGIRDIAAQTADDLARLSEAASEMAKKATRMAEAVRTVTSVSESNMAAAEEMAAGADEVAHSMDTITSITAESAATSEELAASSEQIRSAVRRVEDATEDLRRVADMLHQRSAKFR